MKDSIILFLFLIPTFLFAQYPTGSNKSRLGWQTTGDGLIWRGVAADTVNKPNNRNYPYFQLDTVNAVLYRYIQTRGKWQPVSESVNIDSLIYATRYWVNSNFFPLQGGLLTGTGGNGFVGFPLQSSPPATPATGFSLFAGSTGNNISWMQPDGFFRRLVSPATGTPRQYQFMARSYTLADSADVANNVTSIAANYLATSNGTNLVARNLFDNNTYVGILNSKPFLLGQWTTAGRPTGVNNYWGYNSTTDWLEGYLTSAGTWVSPLQTLFTGGKGTARYLLFSGSDGRATESANLQFNSTSRTLDIVLNTTDNARGINITQIGGGIIAGAIRFRKTGGGTFSSPTAAANGNLIGAFSFQGHDGTTYPLDLAFFGAKITGSVSTGTVPTSIFFNAGQNVNQYNSDLLIYHTGSVGIGRTGNGSVASTMTSPARLLTVYGEARIGDLTTDTPTRIVGADADGDLADITWLVPLSTSSLGIGVTPGENLDVNGDVRVRDSLRVNVASSILQTDANGWIKALTVGSGLTYSGGTLSNSATDTHFANTNLTATGNRIHDWANYNFTWTNMKKFMWGADSLFKITKEFSGYTYAVMRQPNGQALLELQGNNNSFENSAELRFTDTENGHKIFINYDNRGFGSNGFRMEHYNNSNYHNMLFVDQTSRLFHINQGGYSSGTFQDGDAAIMTGLSKNISRDGTKTFNTDTIMAVHYFRAKNNLTKNRDVFGIYGDDGAIDTMYFRSDKTGRLFQYKDAFFTRNVSFTRYGVGNKEAADLSKTQSNYIAGFATDGTILDLERKRDTTIYVDDADYDFSAALTTAQISRRYNRVIFWMTTTGAAGSDSEITLHTPDVNLTQVEYLIHSVDEPAGFDNKIVFGTNNAVDSTNGLVTNYYPAAGDGIHIRAGLRSGVYKYRYSN